MNEHKPTRQRRLFQNDAPAWNALGMPLQQAILELWSQMLIDTLTHHESARRDDVAGHPTDEEDYVT